MVVVVIDAEEHADRRARFLGEGCRPGLIEPQGAARREQAQDEAGHGQHRDRDPRRAPAERHGATGTTGNSIELACAGSWNTLIVAFL